MIEVWKDIPNYEGIYQVSNLGNVRSLDRYCEYKKTIKFYKGINIKGYRPKHFYASFIACDFKRKRKTLVVHRLVAELFIPNPEKKPQVNHIDGDKSNCRFDNLEWVTCSENTIHAYKTGLSICYFGESSSQAKLTEQQVKEIRQRYVPRKYTLKMLAIEYGIGEKTVHYIVRKETWPHI